MLLEKFFSGKLSSCLTQTFDLRYVIEILETIKLPPLQKLLFFRDKRTRERIRRHLYYIIFYRTLIYLTMYCVNKYKCRAHDCIPHVRIFLSLSRYMYVSGKKMIISIIYTITPKISDLITLITQLYTLRKKSGCIN